MPVNKNSLFSSREDIFSRDRGTTFPRTYVDQATNTSHGETGTQTGDSLQNSRCNSRTDSAVSKASILSRRSVKTVVKMNGYPSARVRLLMPPDKLRPLQPPSPKRTLPRSPVRTSNVGVTRVDTKGYVIDHKKSPMKVNYKMPDFRNVQSKIDNRGIDIPKWRYSMLNLRALVDPEEISQGLKEVEEKDRLSNRARDDNYLRRDQYYASSMDQGSGPSPRRYSYTSYSSISGLNQRRKSVSNPNDDPQGEKKTVSADFMDNLQKIFNKTLRNDSVESADRSQSQQEDDQDEEDDVEEEEREGRREDHYRRPYTPTEEYSEEGRISESPD